MRKIDLLVRATTKRHDGQWGRAVRDPLLRELVEKVDGQILPLLRATPPDPTASETLRRLFDESGSVRVSLYTSLESGIPETWLQLGPAEALLAVREDREGLDLGHLERTASADFLLKTLAFVDDLLAEPPASSDSVLATKADLLASADRWIDQASSDLRLRVRRQVERLPENQFRPDGPWTDGGVANLMVGIVRDKHR